jgi:hypothetical protein
MQSGWIGAACLGGGQDSSRPTAILPGSFDPVHAGHRAMAALAEDRLRVPVDFELSLVNVDKPDMTAEALWDRCRHFSPGDTLWVTKARRFDQKARLFPRAWFVVGIDTLIRIIDPAYYDQQPDQRDRALQRLIKYENRFLVFGRLHNDRFQSLSELELPRPFAEYCVEVTESEFRIDVSSTQLRQLKE